MDGSAAGSAAVRLGVAVPIPAPYAGQLDAARAAAGDPLAASIPAHLTLLGPTDVARAKLPAIEAHLGAVARGHPPYPLHLRGTATFRPVTEVVYVAVAGGGSQCEALASAVRSGPLHRRLPFPYHPHVTVAHDVPEAALNWVYDEMASFEARFVVDRFTLFIHDDDGRWRPVRDFSLTGTPG